MTGFRKAMVAAAVFAGLLSAPVAPAFAQDNNTIILEMGRASSDDLRDLRSGEGRVMQRIPQVITNLKESGEVSQDAQVIVVIVKKGSN